MLITPARKHVALVPCAIDSRNINDVRNAERFQLTAEETSHVRVWDSAAAKFVLDSTGWGRKHSHTSRHATPKEIGRLQQTVTACIDRHDYDICLVDG